MKILFFLVCVGAAVYFFCFKKSSAPAPGTAAAVQQSAAAAPAKNKEESSLADIKAKFSVDAKYKKGSLGAHLAELHDTHKFLFDPSLQIKIPKTPAAQIRQELKRYPQALQNARDLQKYNELGIEEFYIFSALKHVGTANTAVNVLICSGFINALDGKHKQAVEDFDAAGKIVNVFLTGSNCMAEMFVAKSCTRRLEKAVNSTRLPAKSKQAILRKLPGKKDWAAAFPRLLEYDRVLSLQIKTFIDAGGDMKDAGMDVSKQKSFKKISRARWEELLNKGLEFIRSEWENGTLSKDTRINVGTAQENMLLEDTFSVQGYLRFLK